MKTHISYETAKMLKEFLGESAPEPMRDNLGFGRWYIGTDNESLYVFPDAGTKQNYPAYQLHDLLIKTFCGPMSEKMSRLSQYDIWDILSRRHFGGGMEAVEKALAEMMEGK